MKKIIKSIILTIIIISVLSSYTASYAYHQPYSSAKAAIVMDTTNQRVLYSKNIHDKLAMASTTKIMTAITAIEYGNLDDVVKVGPNAVNIEGSSIYLEQGEEIKLIDLLYGLMLRSGNDSAIAIAEHVGGTEQKFVSMMNKLAKKIGANNTNFENPHGLDAPGHYTTAYDLALITCYALKNPIFKQIVSTKNKEIEREGEDWKKYFTNKNKILWEFDGGDGVKTGYTAKAGRCLVSSATRDGLQLVCVVLNCGPMFEESMQLLDYFFDRYSIFNIYTQGQVIKRIPVLGGEQDFINAVCQDDLKVVLNEEEKEEIKILTSYNKNIKAPVAKNQICGKIIVKLEDKVLNETNLISDTNVLKKSLIRNLEKIIKRWVY